MGSNTETGRSVDRIFSFINILKIICNIPKYQEWINQYHRIENMDDLFTGYKFFIEVIFSNLLESIRLDSAFGLEEDFAYYRAQFEGVNINEIPNSCEKIILSKNIWNKSKKIRKSKSWKEIENAIESIEDLILIFELIYEKYVYSRKKLNKNEALRIATIKITHIFLNDTREGTPHIYPTSILHPNYTAKYAEYSYKGYTYCLQYLWYILLGQETFENSTIRELHDAHKIYIKQVNEKIEEDTAIFGIIIDEKTLPTLKKWLSIDYFFTDINEEIIKGFKLTNYRKDRILQLKINFNKKELDYLLIKKGLTEPEYLTNDNSKNLIERKLNYYFYWQKINVLDTLNINIFNGISAFLSTLVGRIELNRLFNIEDKIFVLKIKHTPDIFGDSVCSYAILLENYGLLSDYSGWLVFYNCLVMNKNGNLYTLIDIQTEEIVQKYIQSGKIEYNEFMIDEDIFRQYLEEKNISSIFSTIKIKDKQGNEIKFSLSKIEESLNNFIGEVKGKFLEYLFYNWLSEKKRKSYLRMVCNFNKCGEQIDVFAENDKEIQIFECKVSLHVDEIQGTLDQICKKRDLFKSDQKEVITCLVVYNPIQTQQREKFNFEEINVFDNFREEIINWEKLCYDDKMKIIYNIFEFNF